MEFIKGFIFAYRELLTIIVLLAITAAILYKFWSDLALWRLNVAYSFPLFGKLNALKKDAKRKTGALMFNSEWKLGNDYWPLYSTNHKSGEDFEKSKSYLDLVGESTRKPLPIFMMGLLLVLFIAEGLGFSYVVAGFAAIGGSENTQKLGAVLIAFVLAGVMVVLTHRTGRELYINSIRNMIRKLYHDDWAMIKSENPKAKRFPLKRDNKDIRLANHYDDVDSKDYIRYLNRISGITAAEKPKYFMTWITVAIVVFVAIASVYVRGEMYQVTVVDEKTGMEQMNTAKVADPFGEEVALPSDLAEADKEIQTKINDERNQHQANGAWTTFIVLSVLYLAIQGIGVLSGFSYGFYFEDSEEAYKNTRKFDNEDEFVNYYEQKREAVHRSADQKLATLQQAMMSHNDGTTSQMDGDPEMTFSQFVILKEAEIEAKKKASKEIKTKNQIPAEDSDSDSDDTGAGI